MDFVPVTYSREQKRRTRKSVLTRLSIGATSVVPLPALMAMGAPENWILGSLPLAVVGVFFTAMFAANAPEESRAERSANRANSIRESLNDHYGLNLSPDQFVALSYPTGSPGADFQTFGSIKVQDQVAGGNFVERTLYLTSTDGELGLSESRDGKRFKELKPARQALEAPKSSSREALEAPAATESLSPAPSVALGASA